MEMTSFLASILLRQTQKFAKLLGNNFFVIPMFTLVGKQSFHSQDLLNFADLWQLFL